MNLISDWWKRTSATARKVSCSGERSKRRGLAFVNDPHFLAVFLGPLREGKETEGWEVLHFPLPSGMPMHDCVCVFQHKCSDTYYRGVSTCSAYILGVLGLCSGKIPVANMQVLRNDLKKWDLVYPFLGDLFVVSLKFFKEIFFLHVLLSQIEHLLPGSRILCSTAVRDVGFLTTVENSTFSEGHPRTLIKPGYRTKIARIPKCAVTTAQISKLLQVSWLTDGRVSFAVVNNKYLYGFPFCKTTKICSCHYHAERFSYVLDARWLVLSAFPCRDAFQLLFQAIRAVVRYFLLWLHGKSRNCWWPKISLEISAMCTAVKTLCNSCHFRGDFYVYFNLLLWIVASTKPLTDVVEANLGRINRNLWTRREWEFHASNMLQAIQEKKRITRRKQAL